MGNWIIGAAINLVGSIFVNLGTNVMKLGHNKRAVLEVPEEDKPPIRTFREWQLGFTLFMTGNIANFVSFGYAAQSLLAALGSVQFVSNVVFASVVLKETVTRTVLTATACIVGGCVILVAFGDHSSRNYTVKELLTTKNNTVAPSNLMSYQLLIACFDKPAYIVYIVLMAVATFGTWILYVYGRDTMRKKGAAAGVYWHNSMPVLYALFSALAGTQSVLFSKSLSVLLRSTFSGDNQLGNWYTWVVIPAFLVCSTFWVTRLNKGLRMFPAMIIVPTMQIAWTLFAIISGMLYFEEYQGFTVLKAILFPVGVLIVFTGVFLLCKSQSSNQASRLTGEDLKEKSKVVSDDIERNNLIPSVPDVKSRAAIPAERDLTLVFGHEDDESSQSHEDLRHAHSRSDWDASGEYSDEDSVRRLVSTDSYTSTTPTATSTGTDSGHHARGHAHAAPLKSALHKVQNLHKRVKSDFGLDVKLTAAAAGLIGSNGQVPMVSWFGPPGAELLSSAPYRVWDPPPHRRGHGLSRMKKGATKGSEGPEDEKIPGHQGADTAITLRPQSAVSLERDSTSSNSSIRRTKSVGADEALAHRDRPHRKAGYESEREKLIPRSIDEG